MQSESNKAVIQLIVAGNYVVEKMNSFFKIYDLTIQQFNILRILRGQDGLPINLNTLQSHMIHKMSNTTRLVDKLRKKGLVQRKECQENRRKIEIFITDKGLGLLAGIDHSLIKYEQKLTANYNKEELSLLTSLLEKIKQ
ncbi:MarR family winged helix-turn-helix transcriptional regulator [Ochrovirga pacifica]|uniref:MarR family winged helix-turn-helix transcriptional regulator n=1 Tax=Ochrovirga pacifica TaxID=1042376 RepID=UPI0002557B79|nr:MarR family transcriptional regulator [Ochrovirga pacifica]